MKAFLLEAVEHWVSPATKHVEMNVDVDSRAEWTKHEKSRGEAELIDVSLIP